MTWDVPTAEDCPYCGQTMFKKSGKGQKRTFCINEQCENFTPEEKRPGYHKKKQEDGAAEPADKTEDKKSASKKAPAGKTARKNTKTTKKTAAKKKAEERS